MISFSTATKKKETIKGSKYNLGQAGKKLPWPGIVIELLKDIREDKKVCAAESRLCC